LKARDGGGFVLRLGGGTIGCVVARISDGGGTCGLCGRVVGWRTRHHLIPRSRHGNKRVKRLFSREELQRTVPLCGACHRQVHRTLTEKELEREYNTVEALLSHPDIFRFVSWIERKPHGVVDRSDRSR
jgi:5-methylcytosine-specific restriction endonuclease McrA